MRRVLALTILAAFTLAEDQPAKPTADFVTNGGWTRDFEQARKRSKKRDRSILVHFTRTAPMCPLCLALEKRVLASRQFRKFALGYVLYLHEITQDPADRWRYRTPPLRNVALTAPYMHDGSIATLDGVVDFYRRGGIPNEGLDPLIRPLRLVDAEVAALVAFLESLTGGDVEALVADAFAAPVGDASPDRREADRPVASY